MSLPSLAEQFRLHFPAIDQHYREQERVREEAQLVQEAAALALAQQQDAPFRAAIAQSELRSRAENDPYIHDTETVLKIAAQQGLTWSQVVLNGLHLQEAGKRMSRETQRLDRWFFPPRVFEAGIASYSRPPHPSRQIKYLPNM